MTKPLVFMMGRSPVFLPTDRQYARNHMWALKLAGGYRVGLSAYGVKLLGDLSHLGWSVETGTRVDAGQPIGFVEGSKATSDLYAPMSGTIEEINRAVEADPTVVNSNLYDDGWLFAVSGGGEGLLSPEAYFAHLEACWPVAERILKGQAGAPHGR
jgi:glycine cleavage system H protein